MSKLLNKLFELQQLEFEEINPTDAEERIAALRAGIPSPVLKHYDRLCDSGKKGVAIVQHQVCTSCHMKVPLGVVLDLQRGVEICICGNCGRYLHLEPEVPVKKRRTRKAPAPAALIS